MHESSSQHKEMADESMVRNLAAQAEAIWPQEKPIFERHPCEGDVLDAGCGTGEITARLAELFPRARLTGIDLIESHLDIAAKRLPSATFQIADALNLPFEDGSFDLVVCRHMVQAVPDPMRVLTEMKRVLRPGGRMHVVAEDYGMLWAHPTELNADGFWHRLPPQYERAVGCDLHIGRKMFTLLTGLQMADIRVDYIVVDTLRVPRDTFARIWEAWRDGYTDSMAEHTDMPRREIEERFRQLIDCARDPRGYALWQVPVWTAAK